jgi:mannose-6-phosphate isomerase-like protein (cupin superfamily)
MEEVRNVLAAFDRVTEYWSPRVVARVNDQYVKVAKAKGEFVWHSHADEDELFWIVKGSFRLRFEDGEVVLGPGDLYVVPKGKLHKPEADEECWVVLFEPARTKHTGDVESPLTRSIEEQLA